MLANQKGIALIEVIPLLGIFVLMVNFSLGFFGLIHSGIVNSIGARNYAFETFGNRSNLNYLRDIQGSTDNYYQPVGLRFHSIKTEKTSPPDQWTVTKRAVKFTDIDADSSLDFTQEVRDQGLLRISDRGLASESVDYFTSDEVKHHWVRVVYGMCLNAQCERQ